MVEIIWHGHACFELRGTKTTVVIDPFGGIGIPEPKAEADIVLCSHSHGDHNNVKPVLKKGGVTLEGFVGSRNISDVSINGVATFHDATGGSQRGKNSIYIIQLDDIRLCHLGDLGHDLTKEVAEAIGGEDVLFVPIGGGPTIGPDTASLIVERLKPRIVVPMHYNLALPGMPELLKRFNRVDDFLRDKKNVKKLEGRSFIVTKKELPKEQVIIVPSFR